MGKTKLTEQTEISDKRETSAADGGKAQEEEEQRARATLTTMKATSETNRIKKEDHEENVEFEFRESTV